MCGLKLRQADEALLQTHYADLTSKPFFPKLQEYMLSGPVACMVCAARVTLLEGPKPPSKCLQASSLRLWSDRPWSFGTPADTFLQGSLLLCSLREAVWTFSTVVGDECRDSGAGKNAQTPGLGGFGVGALRLSAAIVGRTWNVTVPLVLDALD